MTQTDFWKINPKIGLANDPIFYRTRFWPEWLVMKFVWMSCPEIGLDHERKIDPKTENSEKYLD